MKQAIQSSMFKKTLLVIYVLAVLGLSASARAEMEAMPVVGQIPTSVKVQTIVGKVAQSTDGRFYLFVQEKMSFELRGHEVDLKSIVGLNVQLRGYEYLHRVEPVVQLASFNPLLDGPAELPPPVFVVLQISGSVE